MTRKPREYRRLAGRRNLGWTRNTLWIGPDHLLKITVRSYEEQYKRFYFKDIQALSVLRTDVALGYSAFLVVFIVIMAFISWGTQNLILAACSIGPLGLLLAINLLLGPTCKFQIRTAVQTDRIEAIRRMGAASKVIERLRPLLLEAQGGFTAEDEAAIAAQTAGAQSGPQPGQEAAAPQPGEVNDGQAWEWQQLKTFWPEKEEDSSAAAATEERAPEMPPMDAPPEAAPPPLPERPAGMNGTARPAERAFTAPPLPAARTHAAMAAVALAPGAAPAIEGIKTPGCRLALGLLLLKGFFTLADVFGRGMTTILLGEGMFVALVIGLVVALARLTHAPVTSGLRRTICWTLAYLFIFTIINTIWVSIEFGIVNRGVNNQWEILRWYAGQPVLDSPVRLGISLLSVLFSWGFALVGLRELKVIRAASRPLPATPAQPRPVAAPAPEPVGAAEPEPARQEW